MGCRWYFYGIPMGFQKDVYGISIGFLVGFLVVFLWDFFVDFYDISLWDYYGISIGLLCDVYGMSMVVLWNSLGFHRGWGFYGMSM